MTESSSVISNDFLGRWENLKLAVVEFKPVASSLDQVDDIVQENRTLREQAANAAEVINELQSDRKSLTRTFEERVQAWSSERLELEAQVDQAISRRDDEFSNNERQLRSLETQLSHTKLEILEGTQALHAMQANLTGTQKRLDDLLSALGLIQLDESFNKEMEDLSNKLYGFCQKFFALNLPDGSDKDELFQSLERSQFIDPASPIPVTNSVVSQQLRAATAQSLIVKQITKKVFLEAPRLLRWKGPSSIHRELRQLADKNPLREAVFRSILVTAYADDERSYDEDQLEEIVHHVQRVSKPILPSQSDFQKNLRELLHDALYLWTRARANIDRVTATVEGSGFKSFSRFNLDEGICLGQSRDEHLYSPIILFPRIYTRRTAHPLHCGYVVPSTLFLSGISELQEQEARIHQVPLSCL